MEEDVCLCRGALDSHVPPGFELGVYAFAVSDSFLVFDFSYLFAGDFIDDPFFPCDSALERGLPQVSSSVVGDVLAG